MGFQNPARANDRLGDLMLASSSARLLTGRWAGAKGKEGVLNRRFRADVFASSPNSSVVYDSSNLAAVTGVPHVFHLDHFVPSSLSAVPSADL